MKNKNLIIGGVILAGIVAYYFYNKNKGGSLASSSSPITPASSSPATMGGNLTDCKNIVTIPCLVAPCPQRCADNVTTASSNMPSPIRKGGSPAVGTSSVFDCEKAKVEYKQIYEGVKRMMENFTHFSEKQKNDSICSEMRNAIRTKDFRYSLLK